MARLNASATVCSSEAKQRNHAPKFGVIGGFFTLFSFVFIQIPSEQNVASPISANQCFRAHERTEKERLTPLHAYGEAGGARSRRSCRGLMIPPTPSRDFPSCTFSFLSKLIKWSGSEPLHRKNRSIAITCLTAKEQMERMERLFQGIWKCAQIGFIRSFFE